jgi:hypothetical protein
LKFFNDCLYQIVYSSARVYVREESGQGLYPFYQQAPLSFLLSFVYIKGENDGQRKAQNKRKKRGC